MISINGFGRIGRNIAKIALDNEIEINSINDIYDIDSLCYLFNFDSISGRSTITAKKIDENHIGFYKKDRLLQTTSYTNKANIKDLKFHKNDFVIEATGQILDETLCQDFINNGAKKVIITAPAKAPTFVIGANEKTYNGEKIISNSSCTTNCIAPVIIALNRVFGCLYGNIATVHSYTNSQKLIDGHHKKDLRRGRSANENIIPTDTKSIIEIGKLESALCGRFSGTSFRVPIKNVSISDVTLTLNKRVEKIEIMAVLEKLKSEYENVFNIDDLPLVSSDYVGSRFSATLAADLMDVKCLNGLTNVNLKLWFDNEVGYANRVVELLGKINS